MHNIRSLDGALADPRFLSSYGPQAPSAYSNGPSILEPQIEWIIEVMKKMRAGGAISIEAKRDAETAWTDQIVYLHSFLVSDKVDSWWNGKSVPCSSSHPLLRGACELALLGTCCG